MTDRWLYAWALGSVSFGGASLLVPLYVVQLGGSPVHLGILASTAALVGAPGAVVAGRLANRAERRRPIVLATLVTVALVLAGVPLLSEVWAVVLANAALWLVVASVAPVLTMLVVDEIPESAWSEQIGRLNTYQGYGWAGGLVLGTVWPVVGGHLVADAVTRTLFWILALCAAASALAARRFLPEPAPALHVTGDRQVRRVARLVASSRRGIRGATFAFSPNRLYWTTRGINPRRLRGRFGPALATYLLAAGLFFVGFAAFWAPLPVLLTDAGFDAGSVFALYLVSSLASAVLYGTAGRLAARSDARLLQSGALAVRGLLFPATAIAAGVGATWVGLAATGLVLTAIGVTWSFIAVVGTAIVTELAPDAIRGEILGVYTAVGAVAGGVGGVLGGWAASVGYLAAFGLAGGLVLLGAALVLAVRVRSTGGIEAHPQLAGVADGPGDRPSD